MVQMKSKQKTQECERESHTLTVEMETQRWHCGSRGGMGCGGARAAGTEVSMQGLGLCSVLAFVPALGDVGIGAVLTLVPGNAASGAPRAHRSMEGRSVPFLLQGGIFPAALPAWFGDDLGVKAGIDWEGVIICPAAHLYS